MTTSDTAVDLEREQTPQDEPAWPARLRRFGYAGGNRPGVRERLVPPFPGPGTRPAAWLGLGARGAALLHRWSAWGGPVLVALVAGLLRFWHLGSPHAVIFDETYYAKDAWSLYRFGYEGTWADHANQQILAHPQHFPSALAGLGRPHVLSPDPSFVVHPPLGKWIIGAGEWLFGLDPFGWRFMTAVLGTLSVLMLCRIGRRLFRSTALGCVAGGLMTVDGLHFVMSRTALLDVIVMFWVLAAFGCLLIDRDRVRARLAAALPAGDAGMEARPDHAVGQRLGLGWRPWRLAAGLCLGAAFATKWNGLFYLAAFGLLTVLWDWGSRRTAGAGRPFLSVLRKDALPAFASTVVLALGTYLASWTGWLVTKGGYDRNWAATDGVHSAWSWLPDWLRSLWHYEHQVYVFNVNLTQGHAYQSNPWSWLVLGRPVSYFYESPHAGSGGCHAAAGDCAREVLALGTPLLWWAACVALLYALYRWLFRRDWRAGAILCGVAAGYLPWFHYQERTIFYFYTIVFVPFLCLAVTMLIGALAGPPGVSERRRTVGVVASGILVLLVIWNFVYFWPLYTGQPIPMDAWQHRMWLDTWI